MREKLKHILILLVLIWPSIFIYAQDVAEKPLRPVYSAYMLEVGGANLADTYLTPLHYTGSHLGLQYERTQCMRFNPERWTMQLKLGLNGDLAENPAKNADMYNLALEASWHMMHRWILPHQISWGLGGGPSLEAGCLYLERNGNNPAQAKASVTIDASGYASYKNKIFKIPFTLRYQATLPITGAFFAPDYGQLYYQIYLGDHRHLAHVAWWNNYFQLDNLLTADLHFGATTVRLGYHAKIFSSKVNNIVSRNITQAFVIGVCTEWLSLRPGKRLPDTRIISPY